VKCERKRATRAQLSFNDLARNDFFIGFLSFYTLSFRTNHSPIGSRSAGPLIRASIELYNGGIVMLTRKGADLGSLLWQRAIERLSLDQLDCS
jgi:hypothetical protein